jgi:DNA-binding IclR family transcriptional regulator
VTLKPEQTAPFHSVRYALRVLEAVARHRTGVTEDSLSRETGLPLAQLDQILAMLRRENYVELTTDTPGVAVYVVGESLLRLGAGTDHDATLRSRLRSTLEELRDTVGAAVCVSRYEDGEMSITELVDSPRTPAPHQWIDVRAALHATAMGKCLLSQLDHDARRDHLSRHRAARFTSRTITDERVLLNALDRQPASVPVLDLQEYAVGTVCAAVPITAGSFVGSLALTLPVQHVGRLRRAAELLSRHAAPVMLAHAL